MPEDYIDDRAFEAEPVYFTDMDRCEPSSAVSPYPGLGRWRTLAYEAEGISGTMLLAGPETAAAPVTYRLPVSGWHAISVGSYGGVVWAGEGSRGVHLRTKTLVLARLTGDGTFSPLSLPEAWLRQGEEEDEVLRDMYWKVADLTGQDIVLGQLGWRVAAGDGPGSFASHTARVAYVKVVPLSDSEVEAVQADRRRSDTKRVFVHNDMFSFFYGCRPTTEGDIRRHLEPNRDSDISRVYFEVGGGDLPKYPSRIGRDPAFDGLNDFPRVGDRLHAEARRVLRDKGIDAVRVAMDHTREMGLEFHACYRVAGFHYPPPIDQANYGASFYKQHPEWRGADREGNTTPRMAYSYPGVRRYVLAVLSEILEYGADGLCLLYNRRPPLVEYEQPVVDGFMREYGKDPRQLDDADPVWLRYRARVLTEFMREVRELVDGAAAAQGREIAVSAVVLDTEASNLYNALDLKAWIDEGLVDTLIPYTSEPNLNSTVTGWADASDAEYFVSLTRGTKCGLALNLMPRDLTAEQYRTLAASLYEAGVENLFFWDADMLQARFSSEGSWNALRRLGHRDEVEAWVAGGRPSLATKALKLTRIGDWDVSYDTPG